MTERPPKTKFARWAHRLECPIDTDANYRNTFWCNRDLIPIPSSRRTWTWQGYAGYWVIAGINTTAWTSGSSLLALGLSVPQAMGVMVGVALISAIIAVLAGWPGSHEYLGFTVLCRASWGMRGGFWPVLNRIVTAIVWLGIQMYWGGQAVKIILGALVGRRWVELRNTLPESANVDTASLISFFVFLIIFMPCLMVPPEKLQMPFRVGNPYTPVSNEMLMRSSTGYVRDDHMHHVRYAWVGDCNKQWSGRVAVHSFNSQGIGSLVGSALRSTIDHRIPSIWLPRTIRLDSLCKDS